MKAIVLAVAATSAAFLIPQSWQQESFAGVPYQLPSAVAVAPTANDVWMWSQAEATQTPYAPITVAGVQPDRPNQWAVITDIGIHILTSSSPSTWWIRDGNTGEILYGEPMERSPLSGARHARVHLATPIVLDHSGPNPPVLEFGPDYQRPLQSTDTVTRYSVSFLGRYVYNM